ncbi:MAG: hypothetical protein ACRD5H_00095 [Nitrososphaerales archaeon]
MAFGDSGILDNFNRANEGPPPSANWTTGIGGSGGGLKVVGNECSSDTGAASGGRWNVRTYGADAEAFYRVSVLPATGFDMSVDVRLTDEGANYDRYYLYWIVDSLADDTVQLWKTVNGLDTQLGANIGGQNLAAGDSIGVSAIGDVIRAYYKSGSTAWTEIASRTDTDLAGVVAFVGLEMRDSAVNAFRVDDFGGGNVIHFKDNRGKMGVGL